MKDTKHLKGSPYFHLKDFSIRHDRSSLKVCTESLLFASIIKLQKASLHILDIGAGNGILSIIVASNYSDVKITCLEPHEGSFLDLQDNINQLCLGNRLNPFNYKLDDFLRNTEMKFDTIICNPPFFKDHIKRKSYSEKDAAIHVESLYPEDLAVAINLILKEEGNVWVIYPPYQMDQFLNYCKDLHIGQKILVRNYKDHKPFRIIVELSKKSQKEQRNEIVLYNTDKSYINYAKELLKPYLLNL